MTSDTSLAETNPFATRWVRPGAMMYCFSADADLPVLIERLACHRWWGEIVGPHGSGKSTLLAALAPGIEQSGRRTVLFELHEGERRLPVSWSELKCDAATVVLVDGYEQLSRWHAWRLRRHVRRAGAGLVVTTHRASSLPRLCETRASLELAQRLVAELTREHASGVTPDDVGRFYSKCGGNLRELFFALYDLHETRRRDAGS